MSLNADIRISTSFYDHHKVLKLGRRLGVDGCMSLVILWCGAGQAKPDGVLCGMDNEDIAIMAKWSGDADLFVNTLLDCRLLDRREDGWFQIHDWADHNPYAATALDRKEKAKKAALARHGHIDGKHDMGQNDPHDRGKMGQNDPHDRGKMGQNDPYDRGKNPDDRGEKPDDRGKNPYRDAENSNTVSATCTRNQKNNPTIGVSDPDDRGDDRGSNPYDRGQNDPHDRGSSGKIGVGTASAEKKSEYEQVFTIDVFNGCSNPKLALLLSETSNAPSPSPSPSPFPKEDKHSDCASLHRKANVVRVERDDFIQAVVRAFTETLPDLPRPRSVKPGSELFKAITARCRNNRERRSLSWWVEYFTRVSRSDWLMGRKADWRADALWLVRPKNMEKVLMGSYDSRASPVRPAKGMSTVSPRGSFEERAGFFEDAQVSVA